MTRRLPNWMVLAGLLAGILTLNVSAAEENEMRTWKRVFSDPGTHAWEANWFLDGLRSTVTNTPEGMVLRSGPVAEGDASHAVLWTKPSFVGDLRVEYDFTRLDSATNHVGVCILYLQATGTGVGPHVEDIHAWRDLRQVPKMSLYFNHMNAYHVSYACTGGKDFNYVRARRYPAKGNFDKDTRLLPSYEHVDLFKPGETWHLVFEKIDRQLTFTATKSDEKHVWKWDASGFPPVTGGRLGLRQMLGRESRYANFEVFLPQ